MKPNHVTLKAVLLSTVRWMYGLNGASAARSVEVVSPVGHEASRKILALVAWAVVKLKRRGSAIRSNVSFQQ